MKVRVNDDLATIAERMDTQREFASVGNKKLTRSDADPREVLTIPREHKPEEFKPDNDPVALQAVGKPMDEETIEELAYSDTEIIVDSMTKEVVEDDYEEGEVGRMQIMMQEKNLGTFDSAIRFFQQMERDYDLSSNPRDWVTHDDGRIGTSQLETEEGYAVSSKDREWDAWKDGELTLFAAHYDFDIRFASLRVPSESEIQQVMGISR